MKKSHVAVVGAGSAGLFASLLLIQEGFGVTLYDGNREPGKKFLLASSSGLNITSLLPDLSSLYGERASFFSSVLKDFSPRDTMAWCESLGFTPVVGSGKRVLIDQKGKGDFLKAWWDILIRSELFEFRGGHLLTGWTDRILHFNTPSGRVDQDAPLALFALGGASWPGTGSTGDWSGIFRDKGIRVKRFRPMNCGFLREWSPLIQRKFLSVPLKNIALIYGGERIRGDLMVTPKGMEGGPLYRISRELAGEIESRGRGRIRIDLLPDLSLEEVARRLKSRKREKSLASFLKRSFSLSPLATALLFEEEEDIPMEEKLKGSSLTFNGTESLSRAISSRGGIDFSHLDDYLMMTSRPGWFVAGEMVDWDAPTGGLLLQGCWSTAYRAVKGVMGYEGFSG